MSYSECGSIHKYLLSSDQIIKQVNLHVAVDWKNIAQFYIANQRDQMHSLRNHKQHSVELLGVRILNVIFPFHLHLRDGMPCIYIFVEIICITYATACKAVELNDCVSENNMEPTLLQQANIEFKSKGRKNDIPNGLESFTTLQKNNKQKSRITSAI